MVSTIMVIACYHRHVDQHLGSLHQNSYSRSYGFPVDSAVFAFKQLNWDTMLKISRNGGDDVFKENTNTAILAKQSQGKDC
jgi:hypothetical protein